MEEKLNILLSKCKCSVSIEVNNHRDIYQSVEKYLQDSMEEIEINVFNKMVELNTIIEITFYPDTPIGFYTVFHYDLNKALDESLNCFT